MRGGDGENHYRHLLRHQMGFQGPALPRDSLPPTRCAPRRVLGHCRAGTRPVPGTSPRHRCLRGPCRSTRGERNGGAGGGAQSQPPAPGGAQHPVLVQRERSSKGNSVKILIAFILPIASHSPAGQHTRTHAHTHAHSRTLGVSPSAWRNRAAVKSQRKVSESFGSNHSVCQERGGRAGGTRSFCIKQEAGGGQASARRSPPAPAPLPVPLSRERGCRGAGGRGSLCKRADGLTLQSRAGHENQEGKRCGAGHLVPLPPLSAPSFFFFF